MMFRLMYRLKKKHGAVLFAVIAVMALLIAMSTAAYYTARGSYNSVASSYNYSQLYLSAISSADMITAAIMNEAIPTARVPLSDGTVTNTFGTIQDKIKNDLNAIGDVTYLKTDNLSSVTLSASTSPQTVIDALKTVDPVEAGVLDGLTVEIKVANVAAFVPNPALGGIDTSNPHEKVEYQDGASPFTYLITTTAYYHDNTITVEDVLTVDKRGTRTVRTPWNPPTPGGGGSSSLPSDFNPNIATGQGQSADGDWSDAGRTVIIDVKEINGDMAFRNNVTQIGGKVNLGNTLNGGLVSEGSLYLRYGGPQVTGPNNNWYVGKDLVLADAQSNFDLGQNDLYVGGDFIIGTNGGSIKARDIYVNGDLYVLDQKTIDVDNLHVNGNIYYATYDADGTLRTAAYNRTNVSEGYGSTDDANIRDRLKGDFNLELGGHVITEGKTGNGANINKVTVNVGKYQGIQSGSRFTGNGAELPQYSSTDTTKNNYTVLTPAADGSSYDKVPTSGSALDAIEANTNQSSWNKDAGTKEYGSSSDKKSVYPNYTASQTAYNNEAKIDFGALDEVKNAEGATTGYRGEFPIGSTGEYIVVTIDSADKWNTDNIQIDIPYVEDGFILKYESTSTEWVYDPEAPTEWGGKGAWVESHSTVEGLGNVLSNQNVLHYNIETDPSGKSMPIVLAANKDDGNFSWAGDSGAKGADVSVKGDGKVTFEMGNYNTETGKYEPFKVEDANKYAIPTYIQGKTGSSSTVVGSETQVAEIGGASGFDHLSAAQAQSMTQTSNVMLVSNKSNGDAIKANGKNGVFCGYIYAPNGTLNADNDTNGAVINLGSIVISAYDATHAEYQVSLPTPNDMNDFIGALNGDTGVNWGQINGSPGSPGSPGNPGGPAGPANASPIAYSGFENWASVGSNYVGDPVISVSGGTSEEAAPAA